MAFAGEGSKVVIRIEHMTVKVLSDREWPTTPSELKSALGEAEAQARKGNALWHVDAWSGRPHMHIVVERDDDAAPSRLETIAAFEALVDHYGKSR